MGEEEKKPEALPEVKAQSNNEPEKTIDVDIFGTSVTMPISKAKEIIAKRDTKTKEYNELKTKIVTAESQAKQEAERANLLSLMKSQDAAAVEEAVGSKYRDTINRFEKKVFDGEIQASLAKAGCLSDALQDAAKLIMTEAKPELDGDSVKLNGVVVDDYVKSWIEKKQHLVAVKSQQAQGKTGKTQYVPPKPAADIKANLSKGMGNFLKSGTI